MKHILASSALIALCATPLVAESHGQTEYPSVVVGHAILPGQTLVAAPADAPETLKVSGKFAPARRTEAPTDGSALPFNGQPIQGFSGISKIDDTRYYVLTDNGFGSKANSPDAMLFFHVIAPNWETGEVVVEKTVFLSDPDHVVPFAIQMEGSETRYLTGSDMDPEGFQVIDGKIYIGEEFGPYLIVADAETGVVESFHESFLGETKIVSPDHYSIRAGNPHAPGHKANLRRSRGYEGFAKTVDGSNILGLLEGPMWDAEAEDYERVDGNFALRILEWDVASRAFTGKSMFYRLENDKHAIGDFNMIDETRGLVIERDSGRVHPDLACKDGETENCAKRPAFFKRVYMVDFAGVEDGGAVHKVGYIDLMNMSDPDGKARIETIREGVLSFPFVTIEDVDMVDADHIIVGNDNNYPFSKGRDMAVSDNNELVLLKVTEFLKAAAK